MARSVLMFQPYLDRSHFVVYTDHQTLRWMLNLEKSTGRLARWEQRLLGSDLEKVHRLGDYRQTRDTMLRLSSRNVEEELDSIGEDGPTLD